VIGLEEILWTPSACPPYTRFFATPTMDDQGSPIEEDARNSVGMGLELIPSENAVKDQARLWQCPWLDGQCWSTLAFAVFEDCPSVTHGSRIARREYWRPLTSGRGSCSCTRLPIYTGILHPSMKAEDAVWRISLANLWVITDLLTGRLLHSSSRNRLVSSTRFADLVGSAATSCGSQLRCRSWIT
jgi:hypothetical protein